MKAIRLYSDNCNGQLVTPEAYEELRLRMGTGDFHTHRVEEVEVEDFFGVLTLEEIEGE